MPRAPFATRAGRWRVPSASRRHTAGTEYTLTVEDDWRHYDDDNPPTDEVPGSVPLTYSRGVVPTS
ncbi:MAG: hypothetical protein AAF447_15270 [Myxococcota bacterium]